MGQDSQVASDSSRIWKILLCLLAIMEVLPAKGVVLHGREIDTILLFISDVVVHTSPSPLRFSGSTKTSATALVWPLTL